MLGRTGDPSAERGPGLSVWEEWGVDWYFDSDSGEGLSRLRQECMVFLQRHAEPGAPLDDAELVLSEAIGNAVRHAGGPIWVSMSWRAVNPLLRVYDLGPGFDPALLDVAQRPARGLLGVTPESPPESVLVQEYPDLDLLSLDLLSDSGRGFWLISELAPSLEAQARSGQGMVVSVQLPVPRSTTISHDPPRRRTGALPSLQEAQPEGGFGKEPFLRALVVQLAQAVELQQGPDAADAAVAQVGVDVGGQMEEEYRAAHSVVGRMTPEQIADCYVRLKRAIDGGFYLIEATPDRIVLGNHSCPFGDVVKMAPSLCRMTSSVFGGIAARNSDNGGAVLLEERIALGDPGCKVVVYLGPPPPEQEPLVHFYAAPVDD
jgi:hypothetical protein